MKTYYSSAQEAQVTSPLVSPCTFTRCSLALLSLFSPCSLLLGILNSMLRAREKLAWDEVSSFKFFQSLRLVKAAEPSAKFKVQCSKFNVN